MRTGPKGVRAKRARNILRIYRPIGLNCNHRIKGLIKDLIRDLIKLFSKNCLEVMNTSALIFVPKLVALLELGEFGSRVNFHFLKYVSSVHLNCSGTDI